MNLDELVKRLRVASALFSLRKIGKECDVSHETIRKLVGTGKNGDKGLSSTTYNKIDNGLRNAYGL